MENSLSKAIRDIITSPDDDDFMAMLQAEIDAEVTAEVDMDILKHMARFSYDECDDPFLKELILVEQMLPLLEIAENYCISNPEFKEIDSDCGMFRIQYVQDNCVHFYMKYVVNNHESWHDAALIHFSDINDGNHVNQDKFSYSPMNRGMNVLDCTEYRLNDNLEHDEAWYFQKLTQVDLPEEEYFIEVQRTLENLWIGNYVSLTINMDRIFNERHIEEYRKLVHKLEEQNAEHN